MDNKLVKKFVTGALIFFLPVILIIVLAMGFMGSSINQTIKNTEKIIDKVVNVETNDEIPYPQLRDEGKSFNSFWKIIIKQNIKFKAKGLAFKLKLDDKAIVNSLEVRFYYDNVVIDIDSDSYQSVKVNSLNEVVNISFEDKLLNQQFHFYVGVFDIENKLFYKHFVSDLLLGGEFIE